MKISASILLVVLVAVMFNSASAQHKSKYRAVIKDHEDVRYSGSFISINDSLLVMKGPPRPNLPDASQHIRIPISLLSLKRSNQYVLTEKEVLQLAQHWV